MGGDVRGATRDGRDATRGIRVHTCGVRELVVWISACVGKAFGCGGVWIERQTSPVPTRTKPRRNLPVRWSNTLGRSPRRRPTGFGSLCHLFELRSIAFARATPTVAVETVRVRTRAPARLDLKRAPFATARQPFAAVRYPARIQSRSTRDCPARRERSTRRRSPFEGNGSHPNGSIDVSFEDLVMKLANHGRRKATVIRSDMVTRRRHANVTRNPWT